ncbi:MAG: alkaline phosphatase family protein [Promethearchaeota archaeon]
MLQKKEKKTIIVIFDALPYIHYDSFGDNFFPNLKKKEIIKLETLIGYSAGFYPSIWSGLYPDQTNYWSNFKFNYKTSDNANNITNTSIINKISNILRYFPTKFSQLSSLALFLMSNKLDLFPYNYPACFDFRLKNQFNYEDCYNFIFYPEKERNTNHTTLFSRLRTRNISFKYIDTSQFIYDFTKYKESIIFYMNPILDSLGHKYGPNSKKYKKKIIKVFKWINELISKDDLNIIIFSDHGMTEVREKFNPLKILKDLNLKLNKDIFVWLDSTIVRFWFNSKKSLKLKSELIEMFNNKEIGHILTKSEKIRYGLNFNNRYFGDIIYLVDPYYEIFPNFFNINPFKKTSGLHGYIPTHKSSYGIFYSNYKEYQNPTSIIDLYNLFVNVLKL